MRVESGQKLSGLIAGVMWDEVYGEQTVQQWHATHGASGNRLRGSRVPKRHAQWEEERSCASPECHNVFTVTRENASKRTCSERCSARRYRIQDRPRVAAGGSR
jgi:hypothetical protein